MSNRDLRSALRIHLRVCSAVGADHLLELFFRRLVGTVLMVVVPVRATAWVSVLLTFDAVVAAEVLQLARRQTGGDVCLAGGSTGFVLGLAFGLFGGSSLLLQGGYFDLRGDGCCGFNRRYFFSEDVSEHGEGLGRFRRVQAFGETGQAGLQCIQFLEGGDAQEECRLSLIHI